MKNLRIIFQINYSIRQLLCLHEKVIINLIFKFIVNNGNLGNMIVTLNNLKYYFQLSFII